MNATLAVVLTVLLGIALPATAVDRLTITSPDKATLRDDLTKTNGKWNFVAGQWVNRPSRGRIVLAQVAETQPWAVAILEDAKFADVDATVRFRPVSGREDASGGVILRAQDGQNYLLVRANALENNFRLYSVV